MNASDENKPELNEDADSVSDSPEESAADSAPSPAEQLAQLEQELEKQKDQTLRAQAELENVRKRMLREADQLRQYAIAPLVGELLPVIDNLSRAIAAGESTGNMEELLKGLEMVSTSFEETMSRFGLTKIKAVDEAFDPNKHEALQQVPSPDHEPMQIVQEVETGWQLHDRVIRPSKVIVSSGPPAQQ